MQWTQITDSGTWHAPAQCHWVAEDLSFGAFLRTVSQPGGQQHHQYQRGTVVVEAAVVEGVIVKDGYREHRPVFLKREWVELALRQRLGAFQGASQSAETTTYFFEYGSFDTRWDSLVSILVRGTRVNGSSVFSVLAHPAVPMPLG